MMVLIQGDHAARIVVTLTELVTLSDPFFFFEFTHTGTRSVIGFPIDPNTDQSQWPSRFNQFVIDSDFYFAGQPRGEWLYRIYERQNADSAVGQNLLESGKMRLEPAADFNYVKYSPETSYKAYNG